MKKILHLIIYLQKILQFTLKTNCSTFHRAEFSIAAIKALNLFLHFLSAFSLSFFFVFAADAAKPQALYTAQVIVPSSEVKIRLQSLPFALEQVLIKVSGKSDVAHIPAVHSRLASASAFLQSYRYSMRDLCDGQKALYLQVNFDSKSIRDLLKQTGQPIWGENRPLVLAWIVASELAKPGATAKILAQDDSANPISQALFDNADRFGLPFIFPNMDWQDATEISIPDICNFNIAVLRAAAKRYAADVILLGYISKNSEHNWQGRWAMVVNDVILRWNMLASSGEELSAEVLNNVFASLTKLYANSKDEAKPQKTVLYVTNVKGIDSYAALLRYVRGLNTVLRVNLLEVTNDTVTLSVANRGGSKFLQEAIKSSNKLMLIEDEIATDDNTTFPDEQPSIWVDKLPTSLVQAEKLNYKWMDDASINN